MEYKTLTLKFNVEITKGNIGLVRRIPEFRNEEIPLGDTAKIQYTIHAMDETFFKEDLSKAIAMLFNGKNMISKPTLHVNS